MVVSHHPLFRQPLARLCPDDPTTALCLDLAQSHIACFSAHTNLDVAPGGVNDVLAERIGLTPRGVLLTVPQSGLVKLVTFVPESHLSSVRDAVCRAGAGAISDYTFCSFSSPGMGTFVPGDTANPFSGTRHELSEEPEVRFETLVLKARLDGVIDALRSAHPYEEVAYDVVMLENRDVRVGIGVQGELPEPTALDGFADHVRKALGLSAVRVVGDSRKKVRTVGVLGGSGGADIARVSGKVDVLVTGDVKYHDAMTARARGLAVVDAGHEGTERWIVPAMVRYLSSRFDGLVVVAFDEPEAFRVITG
jgi:dinuclear metal center YbgI/SA1388 family protein